MSVKELMRELEKLPQNMEVRYAVEKGKGRRALYAINKAEVYENAMAILGFQYKS